MLTNRQITSNETHDAAEEKPSTAPIQNSTYQIISTFLKNTLPASLTGNTAQIQGYPTLDLWSPGGLGIVMTNAENAASSHPSNICTFYIGLSSTAYVRQQHHIAKIYYNKNRSDVPAPPKNGDQSGIYSYLFGPSILSYMDTDPRWQEERAFYKDGLLNSTRLAHAANEMHLIMQDILKTHPPENITNLAELRTFVNRTIITMVAQTQLGIIDLTDTEKDMLANLVNAVLPQIASLENIFYFKMKEKIGCRPRIPLDKILEEGYPMLQKLLNRNKKNILKESNNSDSELLLKKFLRKNAEENKINLETALAEYSSRFAALVLFAGYESTSTSLFFTLLLLADPQHGNILNTLKHEISIHWNGEEALTKAHLDKIKSLDQVIREGLRLYPPFPTFKDVLTEDVQLDDVLLKKGTIILISPYRTHRLENTGNVNNPGIFNLRANLDETSSNCQMMTFGYPPRTCPGRLLAMLENKIVITMLLNSYQPLLKNLQHPFPTKEVYSLQLADSVDAQKIPVSFAKMDKELQHSYSEPRAHVLRAP